MYMYVGIKKDVCTHMHMRIYVYIYIYTFIFMYLHLCSGNFLFQSSIGSSQRPSVASRQDSGLEDAWYQRPEHILRALALMPQISQGYGEWGRSRLPTRPK